MNAELILPPEITDEIVSQLFKKIKPLLIAKDVQVDAIFDVKKLARYLNVKPKWIYDRTSLKEIPHNKISGQLRFRKKDIDRWIDSYKVPAINTPTSFLKAVR